MSNHWEHHPDGNTVWMRDDGTWSWRDDEGNPWTKEGTMTKDTNSDREWADAWLRYLDGTEPMPEWGWNDPVEDVVADLPSVVESVRLAAEHGSDHARHVLPDGTEVTLHRWEPGQDADIDAAVSAALEHLVSMSPEDLLGAPMPDATAPHPWEALAADLGVEWEPHSEASTYRSRRDSWALDEAVWVQPVMGLQSIRDEELELARIEADVFRTAFLETLDALGNDLRTETARSEARRDRVLALSGSLSQALQEQARLREDLDAANGSAAAVTRKYVRAAEASAALRTERDRLLLGQDVIASAVGDLLEGIGWSRWGTAMSPRAVSDRVAAFLAAIHYAEYTEEDR